MITGTLTTAPPLAGRQVLVEVTEPVDEGHPDYPVMCNGATAYYYEVTDAWGHFYLDPGTTGDEYFGTTCRGTWQAQAFYDDPYWGQIGSNTVTWEVRWFPVHLTD